MDEPRSVTGSIRAKLVRRFTAVAVGAALAACSIGYAAMWAWSVWLVQDLATRPSAASEGENPQTGASALLGHELDRFLHERIADVHGWASAPTVLHAAQQAHVLREESGLLDLTAEALENRLADPVNLGRFSVADGYLRSEIARSEHFDWMRFTDRNGIDVVVTDARPAFVHHDAGWWQRAWSDGAAIDQVAYDEETALWWIDISMRIDEPATGNPVGVLQTALSLVSIQDLADRFAARGHGERITVADHDGLIVAETGSGHSHTRLMNENVSLRLDGTDTRQAAFKGDSSGHVIDGEWTTEYSRTADEALYADVARGSRFPGFEWVVIVQSGASGAFFSIDPLLEIVGAWRRTYAGILGGSLLVIALVSGCVVWWMASRISSPVRYLRATAVEMSKGRLGGAVRLDTNDELSEVADALERMRRIVQRAVHLLREQRRGSNA